MGELQSLGADPICNIVAFALGADVVALLTTSRCVHQEHHVVLKKFKLWTHDDPMISARSLRLSTAACFSSPCGLAAVAPRVSIISNE